jgi:hypothetical protein
LEARGNVDPVALHIALLLHDIAQVEANANVDLVGGLLLSVISLELRLNVLRTLHGVDHGGKLQQEAVPRGLNDLALMVNHGTLNEDIVHFQQPQHAYFVGPHLAAEAYEVREHDGSQAAGRRSDAGTIARRSA